LNRGSRVGKVEDFMPAIGRRAVLTLTENASTIVKDINDQIATQQGQPEAGLRITGEEGPEPSFAVSAADEPAETDQVVEQDGARVFLDQAAQDQLDDKVLDASVDQGGNVSFALGLQD